jgi:hypothetical protein
MSEHLRELLLKILAREARPPLLAATEDNPPLFDWRLQLGFADAVIARVGAKKRNHSAIGRPSAWTDLSKLRDDIAKLLAELQEIYIVARDDFELRNDPKRPGRKLRKRDVLIVDGAEGGGIDFSEYDGDTDWDWGRVYDDIYCRPRGAPGGNRHGGPPIAPLHPIYRRVRDWWRQHGLGRFHPTCAGEDEAFLNPASRFLLSVIQSLDPAYTIENVRGLYETLRKK